MPLKSLGSFGGAEAAAAIESMILTLNQALGKPNMQATEFDPNELEDAYGNSYDYNTMREAKKQVSDLLDEDLSDSKPRSVRQDLQQKQKEVHQLDQSKKKYSRELER